MSNIIISGEDLTPQDVFAKKKSGTLRQVFKKVYTDDLTTDLGEWVFYNHIKLIIRLFPNCVMSHRSAFNIGDQSKMIYITWDKASGVHVWPGMTIHCIKGPAVHEFDTKFLGLAISSQPRYLLENLQSSRQSRVNKDYKKTVEREDIEELLEKVLLQNKEEGLNKLRDNAKKVSEDLDMGKEFKDLSNIISSLLQSGPSKNTLTRPTSRAYAMGIPYDDKRQGLFTTLGINLITAHRQDRFSVREAIPTKYFSFFEAYFSNFIEGTEFEVDEAQKIIFEELKIPLRDDDSHDIIGTFNLLVNEERSLVPKNAQDLLDILQRRHRIILSSRKDKHPGEFKSKNNRAGSTHFVDFSLVKGTLIKGFEIYESLPEGFPRAVLMMALISEVHPFDDGNGRLARIMMNAELESVGECRIIVPTSMRGDYLRNLKAFSNKGLCENYIRVLELAQLFSYSIPSDSMKDAVRHLDGLKSFDEENG